VTGLNSVIEFAGRLMGTRRERIVRFSLDAPVGTGALFLTTAPAAASITLSLEAFAHPWPLAPACFANEVR
jgi:hypothetical protein